MSKPSFSNIDLWLFELVEGNLTPEQVEQLELFLMQHPDLDVERDMWEMAKVENEPAVYTRKEAHRKRRPVGLLIGAASTVVIASSLFFFDFNSESTQSSQLAVNYERIEVNEVEILNSQLSQLKKENEILRLENSKLTKESRTNQEGVTTNGVLIDNPTERNSEKPSNSANTSGIELINRNDVQIIEPQIDNLVFYNAGDAGVNYDNEVINTNQINSSEYDVSPHQGILTAINVTPLKIEEINSNNSTSELTFASNSKEKEEKRMLAEDWYKDRKDWSYELTKLGRKIKRMMDNPVALYNSRDPYFQLPGMTVQDVNFSATGTMMATRVQTLSRLQWLGSDNEQMYNQLAIDGYAYGMRGGIGLQLSHSFYHTDGSIQIADAALTYSPKISVNNFISVEPSVRFKMGNKMIQHSKLDGVPAIEMDRGNVYTYGQSEDLYGNNLWYKDLGAGLMVNTRWFFASAQVDNLFKHYNNIYNNGGADKLYAGLHYIATIGTDWKSLNEKTKLSPYLVYQNKEQLQELWFGANFQHKWITAGASVSTSLDPTATVGMVFKNFALHYNADYTMSKMSDERYLSHQLTLKFNTKPSPYGRRLMRR